jgi:hypothetical protein
MSTTCDDAVALPDKKKENNIIFMNELSKR